MRFSTLSDGWFTHYTGLRMYTVNEQGRPLKSYDAVSINLSVRPVTAMRGGVTCTLRVIGETSTTKSAINFPVYEDMHKDITTGKRVSVELLTKEEGGEEEKTILITGRVAQTSRTNASYANILRDQLEVAIATDWDFLNVVPRGLLVTPSLKNVNYLIKDAWQHKNKQLLEESFKQHLGISSGGSNSINIAKAVAATIDYAETIPADAKNGTKDKIKKAFQDNILVDDAAMLKVPKEGISGVISAIARGCAGLIGRSPHRETYVAILNMFYYMLTPYWNEATGVWKPMPYPNNIWGTTIDDEGYCMYTPDVILAVNQSAMMPTAADVAGIAVRYVRQGGDDGLKGIDQTRVAIYAHRANKTTGKLERVVINAADNSTVQASKVSNGELVDIDGSLLLKDLPSWIGFTYPGQTHPARSANDWRDAWADFVATAEFAKCNGERKTMSVQLALHQLKNCLNRVGEIVSVNYVPVDGEKVKNKFDKQYNYYGRVAGVDFRLFSDLNQFKATLTMTLEGVRNYEEQKALSIPNSKFFDNI